MKKSTPMQMRKKEVKPDAPKKVDKKNGQGKSAMERYAQERNTKIKAASVPTLAKREDIREYYDPHSDMHTLARAAEIHAHPKRHAEAKAVAKKKLEELAKIAG
jgi:hypothetical protein